MFRLALAVGACAILALAAGSQTAPAPAAPIYATPPIGELRGIWAHASSTHNRQECDHVLNLAQDARLNCIYWLGFYWGGKCFFRNPYVSMPETVEPGFDPLAYLIREGHRRGIEIHLRFVNGENGSEDPGPFLGEHPDWCMVNADGQRLLWYDFANPEVRDFQVELMLSTLRAYPELDGLQFDFVRYDDGAGSFSPAACKGFAEATGIHWESGGAALPTVAPIRGNPLDGPTTGFVLARFGNGVPAVVGNNVGRGGALLLNWHAESGPFPLVTTILQRAIASARQQKEQIPLLRIPESDEWWPKYHAATEELVRKVGYQPAWVSDEVLTREVKPPMVMLPNAYRIPPPVLAKLVSYAEQGGWVFVIDGPMHAIEDPQCQRLLGLTTEAPYLGGLEALLPGEERTPLIDVAAEVTPEQRARYRDLGTKWRQYQAGCITDLVRRVHEGAHTVKPDIAVTACTFHRRSSAESLFQYWHDWVKEGLIDYAIPMAYTPDNESLRKSMREWLETDPTHQRVAPSLGIYDIDGDGQVQSPQSVLTQMKVLREEGGYPSIVFFSLSNLQEPLVKALAEGPFRTPVPRKPSSATLIGQ